MKRSQNILNGRELADLLPVIKEMHEKGYQFQAIAKRYNLSASTIHHYYRGYNSYLRGITNSDTDRFKRAIPYLNNANPNVSVIDNANSKKGITRKRMTDKELANALPIMYNMRKKGVRLKDIGQPYNLAASTVSQYCSGYHDYLKNLNTPNREKIKRAVRFMEKQTSISERVVKQQTPVKSPNENNSVATENRREVSIFWGLIAIKY
jgi:predicted transcriptional regulator